MTSQKEIRGTLGWVDIFSCTLSLSGGDGEDYVLPFDQGPNSVNFMTFSAMTGRPVTCVVEDGTVVNVETIEPAKPPAAQ